MSSIPLISHHLFVAAVKEKSCASPAPGQTEVLAPTHAVQVREVPLELVDFGRPLATEVVASFEAYPLPGSS